MQSKQMNLKNSIITFLLFLSLSTSANNELLLHENRLGNLYLIHGMEVDLKNLRRIFNDFEIERKIGQQDGPDFVYYEARKNAAEYFWLKTQDDNKNFLDRIYITNLSISDQYGVNIGMNYKLLKQLRKNIKVSTEHYHTYAYVTGSNIAYEITGTIDGPDKEHYTEEEIKNWQVSKIIWLNSI